MTLIIVDLGELDDDADANDLARVICLNLEEAQTATVAHPDGFGRIVQDPQRRYSADPEKFGGEQA